MQFYPLFYFLQNIWHSQERFVWHQKICFLICIFSTYFFLFELFLGPRVLLDHIPEDLIQLLNVVLIGIPGSIYTFWVSTKRRELPLYLIVQMRSLAYFFTLYTACEGLQAAIIILPQLNSILRNTPTVPLVSSLCVSYALFTTIRSMTRFPIVNIGYVTGFVFFLVKSFTI